ncbi:MAG: sigma-54 dependent transcriptional regulator [Pseudomonadota bacterium]
MADILLVDDEEKMRRLLSIILERAGYSTETAGDGQEAMSKLTAGSFKIVISDIKMPRMDGRALLEAIRKEDIPVPVVFITAFATVASAVEFMRLGASDYITKPFDEQSLLITVERTLALSRVMQDNQKLRHELESSAGNRDFIFVSEIMNRVVSLADKVAGTDSAVMITGQSGTGKEVMARYIHNRSNRKKGRFVPVNCAAISPNLVESELFGYEKGAFTGAAKRTQGKFEFASGGTLFLDEIGDLPLESQGKFLRALQEKKIQRVGGHDEIAVDTRVICATNRNLAELVDAGTFRRDLFYRINVFPIELPPLVNRKEDIVPLAEHFLAKTMPIRQAGVLDKGAISMLLAYDWPGNVRELANVMERAAILSGEDGSITSETLSFLRSSGKECDWSETQSFVLPPQGVSLDDVEKTLVEQALKATGNNQTAAAEMLGLTRAKFRVLMKNFTD